MKFCPQCGKKGIKGDLCSSCTTAMISNLLEFKDIKFKVCVECKKYFWQNKWIKYNNLAEVLKKITKKNINKKITADIIPHVPKDLKVSPGLTHKLEVEVALSPKEQYYLPAEIEMTTCHNCSRKGGQYFESVLQLRDADREILDFVRDDVYKNREKGIFVTKETKTKTGYDLMLTSNKYAQQVGKKLMKRFGGILKVNPRLYSVDKQTSKEIYRMTVFYQAMPFKVGDVIQIDDRILKVTELGKQVYGVDLKLNKKFSIGYKKKEIKVLTPVKVNVVKDYPHVEILHPETYESVKVENKKKVKAGEEVKVVILEESGKIFLI